LSRELLRAAQLSRDLHQSEQRMSLAAEAANLGVWYRDFSRDEFWATDQWRALFGFTKSERLPLEYFLQRLHAADRETTRQALAKAREGGGYEAEYRVVLPDGQTRWIASRGRVEFTGGGEPVRLRGISVDISRRKQAELEALSQRNQIIHLLRVATLGELSAALAHELNQPLAAILSNAQAAQRFLAQAGSDPEEIREILADIVADDQRASEVIRRLRTLLKKGEFHPQPLDVNELLQEVRKLMSFDLSARAVSVNTHFAAGLPAIRGDRVQLQQVLINLILNASDALAQTPAGARAIALRSNLAPEGAIRISVADTGCGIQPGQEEKIFEPYHTAKPHGLGLGLSLSRSIIVAHGGRLWAENQPGGGAVFHIIIPELKGDSP
jgi:C4-dicarboxylate-specific signal transduction histidine kinase